MAETYICPYCGKTLNKNNILFVNESFDEFYADTLRYTFLRKCCTQWPFENGDRFKGLYFYPDPDHTMYSDESGLPKVTFAPLSAGMTPRELEDPSQLNATGETKPVGSDDAVPLSTRVCSHCHCRLPTNFGVYPTLYVTMLGGRAAGKTSYLLSLIHQLNTQLGARNLGSANLETESQKYYNFQNKYYQDHQGVTMPTPKDETLFPFVFEYTFFRGSVVKNCFIAIYDIAGEGVSQPDYLLNHLGIRQAKTVLLVLDPNMLNGGGYDAAMRILNNDAANLPASEAVPGMGNVVAHDFYGDTLNSFLTSAVLSVRSLGVLQNVRQVISITTKMDQPLVNNPTHFMGNCLMKEDLGRAHFNKLDMDVVSQLQNDVRIFYKSFNIDLHDMIKAAFSAGREQPVDVFTLAVSTYTRVKTDAADKLVFSNRFEESAAKHRIIEPFLVLLARADMIPLGTLYAPAAGQPVPQQRSMPAPAPQKRGLFGRRK